MWMPVCACALYIECVDIHSFDKVFQLFEHEKATCHDGVSCMCTCIGLSACASSCQKRWLNSCLSHSTARMLEELAEQTRTYLLKYNLCNVSLFFWSSLVYWIPDFRPAKAGRKSLSCINKLISDCNRVTQVVVIEYELPYWIDLDLQCLVIND